MNDKEKSPDGATRGTAILVGFLFFVPNWWLSVVMVKLFWEWFVWPTFGWPPITMLQSFAIVLMRSIFSVPDANELTQSPARKVEAYVRPTLYCLFMLAFGWIVRQVFFPSAGPMFWGGR